MNDSRELLDRIAAFRQRLAQGTPAPPRPPVGPDVAEGPPTYTARARSLMQQAHALLAWQRAFNADPVFVGLSAVADPAAADPLVAYSRETVAVMDSAVRLMQALPTSPSVQLKLCDGLEGMLEVLKERHRVQDRALAGRKADAHRVDRLAAIYVALHQRRAVTLQPLAALAEELLEDARQTRPIRFLDVAPDSTCGYPGGLQFPAPARFAAAHALNTAQVVARVVQFDYEWAGRPLLPVVAALLMDCGMTAVPAAPLASGSSLFPDARRQVEGHARYGAELVLRYLAESVPLAEAIATHHERPDGTGYPAGLSGDALPPLGRLLAVAGTYAALCSNRPHRPALDTRGALTEVLLQAEQKRLDKDFAEYLLHLTFYPVGTVVELTDGRIGMVAAVHPNRLDPRTPARPVVAILAEADGSLLPRPEHVDLSASDRGGIVRGLPADRRRAVLGHRYPDLL